MNNFIYKTKAIKVFKNLDIGKLSPILTNLKTDKFQVNPQQNYGLDY